MKIIYNDDIFFHISLENIFSNDVLGNIFKEIGELEKYVKDPEFTKSACSDFGILKKNSGVFLSNCENYENLKTIEFIDECIKKISISNNWKNIAFKRLFNSLMWGGELLNCYKKNDYYKPHLDEGIFTLIFFLWESSSNFEGGDLFFPEHNYLHKCKNNHGILFFSKEFHGVTPIIAKHEMSKRYSIVTFSKEGSSKNKKIDRHVSKSSLLSYH